MINFYKPTKSNKGAACSFNNSFKNDCIFVTIIKQAGWDEANGNGVFKDSINDPEKNIKLKISDLEIAGILDCIERARPFSGYHDNEKEAKGINFNPWVVDGNQKGFTFSINLTKKDDSSYKNGFFIGFTFAEARLIREFLIHCLHEHFNFYNKQNKENFVAKKPSISIKKQSVTENSQPQENEIF